jgi:hypothetical protein
MSNRPDDNDPADDVFADDDMFGQRERQGERRQQRPRVVSEFVRRAIENTVGSVTNTGNLSREALNYLLQQGDRGKREVVRIVAQEVGEFLRGIDLSSEVVKVLSNIQVDVNASIRFKPSNDGSLKPEITSDATVTPVKDGAPDAPDPATDRPEPSKPPEDT